MDKRYKPITPVREREIMSALKAALSGIQIGNAVRIIIDQMHILPPTWQN